MLRNLADLLRKVKKNESRIIAVAAAADYEVIEVVEEAERMGIAKFILVGDKLKIEKIVKEQKRTIEAQIVDELDDKKAAEYAVFLVREGKAQVVMKGLLHTAVFMKAVLNKERGLNKGNLVSQISIIDKIKGDGLQMITDGVISIAPDLEAKKKIIENAVELSHKLDNECPKVALIAALEVINSAMQDTLDDAVLCKMNDRKQISGCVIDGPLALDNAVSLEAAMHKGIESPVAGQADILVVPNIIVGNVFIKAITYYAQKDMASAIVGTSAPVIMTSRTDSIRNKILSIALASYIS